MFQAYGAKQGPMQGLLLSTPYMTKDHLQLKRFQAQSNGTTYVYDYPEMFRQALHKIWIEHSNNAGAIDIPTDMLTSDELVLNSKGELVSLNRLPGENEVGMVAWKMTLKTPEFPEGRDIIVISNDITHKIGSFGTKEDQLFNVSDWPFKLYDNCSQYQYFMFVYICNQPFLFTYHKCFKMYHCRKPPFCLESWAFQGFIFLPIVELALDWLRNSSSSSRSHGLMRVTQTR